MHDPRLLLIALCSCSCCSALVLTHWTWCAHLCPLGSVPAVCLPTALSLFNASDTREWSLTWKWTGKEEREEEKERDIERDCPWRKHSCLKHDARASSDASLTRLTFSWKWGTAVTAQILWVYSRAGSRGLRPPQRPLTSAKYVTCWRYEKVC